MIRIYWLCLIALFVVGQQSLNAQYKLNFGMPAKQPASELPKSKAEIKWPTQKVYQHIAAELAHDKDGNLILDKGWEMIEAYKLFEKDNSLWTIQPSSSNWYNAVVPGTVLTTLVEQGVYPDPYYGLNNLVIPDTLCRMDWWYRIAFDMPQDTNENDYDYDLLLNGINYKADIWLNGKRIGNMIGAFKRGIFSLSGLLKRGEKNILAVHIFPPNNPGIPHEQNKLSFGGNGGALCLDGPTFISSEGWDWIPGIRDRNIGIWQDVRLVKTGAVKIKDCFVITDLPLPDTSYADLCVKTDLTNTTQQAQTFVVKGKIENIDFSREITLLPREKKEIRFAVDDFKQLRFQNPKLWWPNGYGDQPLYNLIMTIEQNNKVVQTKNVRFGIRELTYGLMAQNSAKENIRLCYSPTNSNTEGKPLFNYKNPIKLDNSTFPQISIPTFENGADKYIMRETEDSDNPFLTILVNGKKIFCRGGNWGMDDGMKRTTRERLEPNLKLHKQAGFTMIRNWTGESTEELLYDLCDEYGLLVWNDFMISTQKFNLEPIDHQLLLDNVYDIVRRFRNHPSIAIWCPRNEGYAPEALDDGFQQIIALEDGTRHYHGNSRDLNLCSSGPWHYLVKSAEYLTKKADGFTTELGSPAVPTATTIRKFIPDEDIWPIGDVWYYHDLHLESFDWKDYIRDVNRVGKTESQNVDEFAARAQFVNYNCYRNMFESWNHKMWNYASGILLWMSHPAWPSMTWQTYSYDYETPGSYFGSKKACEPIHIQWNSMNKKLQIVNVTQQDVLDTKVTFSVYDIKGKLLHEKKANAKASANQVNDCFSDSIPSNITDLTLVRTTLRNMKGEIVSTNDYWINPKDCNDYSSFDDMGKTLVSICEKGLKKENGSLFLQAEVKNVSKTIALGVKLNARDSQTDEMMLPAYISDGYFNLLPGEKRIIDVEIPNSVDRKIHISADGLNIHKRVSK